jgi:hypothetical protein
MIANALILTLGFFLGSHAFGSIADHGGDTPFLKYLCTYGRPSEDKVFEVQFYDDAIPEVVEWTSPLSRTKMRFEKMSRESVVVQITSGMPLVAHVTPEEFRFTAPLTTEKFDFSMGINPLTIKGGDVMNLNCAREKREE